jgi:hypothetical protein
MTIELPVQPIKDWYVTLFGGRSRELNHDQVGINKENLEKTDLTPYVDKVSIRRLEGERVVPLYLKKWFEVVPLDRSMPDALSKSPHGEVVLPEEPQIINRPSYYDLNEKEPLILNSVLSKVLKNPSDWSKLLLSSYIMKKKFSFRR